jgi:hypothetical protein
LLIEILILLAILWEIGWSIYDRKRTSERDQASLALLNEIKDILDDSRAELADIRDETVEEEDEQSRS